MPPELVRNMLGQTPAGQLTFGSTISPDPIVDEDSTVLFVGTMKYTVHLNIFNNTIIQ